MVGLLIRPSVKPIQDDELQGEALFRVHPEGSLRVRLVAWHNFHWVQLSRRRRGVDARSRASLPETMATPLVSNHIVPRLRLEDRPIEGGFARKGIAARTMANRSTVAARIAAESTRMPRPDISAATPKAQIFFAE